jgi:hypothetical protein
MMPTVEDICIKDIKYVFVDDTVNVAIGTMIKYDLRSVFVKSHTKDEG